MDSPQSSAKYDIEMLPAKSVCKPDLYDDSEGSVDPVYQAKTRVLNLALQEIGMGKYQVNIYHY